VSAATGTYETSKPSNKASHANMLDVLRPKIAPALLFLGAGQGGGAGFASVQMDVLTDAMHSTRPSFRK
jgi:hypothetical protein